MATNELVVGEPRIGWFEDGNPNTHEIAVMLRDTGTAIELTLPLQGMFGREDPYGRWFAQGIHFGDDPGRTRHSYTPPRIVMFRDSSGNVTLVGCRAASSSSNLHVGYGRLVANYAVFGASTLRYEKVHGIRTQVPALAAWTRLSSMELEVTQDAERRVQSVQMRLTDAPDTRLARPLNLTMRSSWRTEKGAGEFIATEGVQLGTSTTTPRSWNEHLAVHGAVLDLVSLAAWQPFGFSDVYVHRVDDPIRTMSGEEVGARWSNVATHRLPRHVPWDTEPSFLFPFSEVGPRGVARWLRLRKDFSQAIGPLLGILRSEDRWTPSSVVQSGVALEALGYLVDTLNGGGHLNRRGQINFKPALQVVLNDMKADPLADSAGWIDRASDVYMSAKHPDRPVPDSLIALNTLRVNLLILRYWIAQRIGVTSAALQRGLSTDPLSREWVLVD